MGLQDGSEGLSEEVYHFWEILLTLLIALILTSNVPLEYTLDRIDKTTYPYPL